MFEAEECKLWDEECLETIANSAKSWIRNASTNSAEYFSIFKTKYYLTLYKECDVADDLQKALPSVLQPNRNDLGLIYPVQNQDNSSPFIWIEHWKSIAKRLQIAHVEFNENDEIRSISYKPPRIVPHLMPYLSFLIGHNWVATVTFDLFDNFCSLENFLRYHRSHVDYDSQVLNLVAVSLTELHSQLFRHQIHTKITLDSLWIDDAAWLLYDFVGSFFPKEKIDIDFYTRQWVTRGISNHEYLVKLNEAAGRTRGDVHNHFVFPWVVDFTSEDSGWRPLNRTKFRLNKGDDQLREMFKRSPSHHISELLSDIGYMVYRARVESKEKLCKHVRSKWVPEEYPTSIRRMYEWTPDECIPEFYEDPAIFESKHLDMPSLELPPFTLTPTDFVKWHREKLESEEVSAQLHRWIDMNFGYQLSGEEAVRALNVHLSLVDRNYYGIRRHGVVQLFSRPHPPRVSSEKKNDNLFEEELFLKELYADPSKSSGSEETREEDPDSLCALYKALRCVNSPEEVQVRSLIGVLAQFALAPVSYGRFDNWQVTYRENRYFVSENLRQFLDHFFGSEKRPLPAGNSLSILMMTSLNIMPALIGLHDQLATFYNFHILRCSPAVGFHADRLQSILVREVDALRRFGAGANQLQFVLIPLIKRLLENPFAAVNTNALLNESNMQKSVDDPLKAYHSQNLTFELEKVHRLTWMLCRCFDRDSLNELTPALVGLITCETSVKLLDRRFILPLSIVYGAPAFFDHFLPPIVEATVSKQTERSMVAKETLTWLSKRYGPVVTVRFITSNLLRILPSCYDEMIMIGGDQEPTNVFCFALEGDSLASRAESVLTEIAASYSVTFVTVQYLPFCVEIVDQCCRRLTSLLESGVLAVCRIVSICIRLMTDHQLMNYLEEFIVEKIIFRLLQLSLNTEIAFTTSRKRLILLSRIICLIYDTSIRIGADNARTYMKKPFETLFEVFARNFTADDELRISKRLDMDENVQEIPNWMVSDTIDRFVSAWGVPLLSALCPDPAFLVPFVTSLAVTSGSPQLRANPIAALGAQFGGLNFGNRLISPSAISQTSLGGLAPCDSGALSALWCARVAASTAASQTRPKYRFDNLSLCSFEGHTASIKCLAALSNENSYASGSSDKTVKLWSMRCEQDRAEAQWTYTAHARTVTDLIFVDGNSIASTDGTVHVWDPFRGSLISQIDWPEGNACSLSAISRNTFAAISSLHSTVRLYDTRTSGWCGEWKVSTLSGLTRAIATQTCGYKMAVAMSNGTIVIVDSRTGKLSSLSHGNSTHPTAIHWLSSNELIVCDSDEPAVIFFVSPRLTPTKRLAEPVSTANFNGSILATVQSTSILRAYNITEMCLESKLKPEGVSGSASSLVHLPLNNAFLVGFSHGALHLLC